MSAAALLYEDRRGGVRVYLHRALPSDATRLIEQSVWGSIGLRYRVADAAATLGRLREPHVLTMQRGGRLVAVAVLDRCRKAVGNREFETFHVVMLATAAWAQAQGLGALLARVARQYCRQTLAPSGLMFAYIEAETSFSLRIADDLGQLAAAELSLLVFSRLWPRRRAGIVPLPASEANDVLGRLKALYRGHELQDFDRSLDAGAYHVLVRHGRIVAGVQTDCLERSIVAMPGVVVAHVLRCLRCLPGLWRRLDPDPLRVLRFGNVLLEAGAEAALPAILEDRLAAHDAALGLVIVDRRSDVVRRMTDQRRFGVVDRVFRGSVRLCIDGVGLDDSAIAALRSRPLLASPADVF